MVPEKAPSTTKVGNNDPSGGWGKMLITIVLTVAITVVAVLGCMDYLNTLEEEQTAKILEVETEAFNSGFDYCLDNMVTTVEYMGYVELPIYEEGNEEPVGYYVLAPLTEEELAE